MRGLLSIITKYKGHFRKVPGKLSENNIRQVDERQALKKYFSLTAMLAQLWPKRWIMFFYILCVGSSRISICSLSFVYSLLFTITVLFEVIGNIFFTIHFYLFMYIPLRFMAVFAISVSIFPFSAIRRPKCLQTALDVFPLHILHSSGSLIFWVPRFCIILLC